MLDSRIMTVEYLNEAFKYDDGSLIWKTRPLHHFKDEWRMNIFNSRQSGTVAGSINRGYVMVRFATGKAFAHRIIFLMHNGFVPDEVDHIDGDSLNNRIENLRAATHSQNLKNMNHSKANTSGRKGVYFHKATGKWIASIRVSGKLTHIGLFDSFDDACNARLKEEIKHYGEFRNER